MINLDKLKSIHDKSKEEQRMLDMKLKESHVLDVNRGLKKQASFIFKDLEPRLLFAAENYPYMIVGRFPLKNALEEYFTGITNESCIRIFRQLLAGEKSHEYVLLPERYITEVQGNLQTIYNRFCSMGLKPFLCVSGDSNHMDNVRKEFEDYDANKQPIEQDIFQENVFNLKPYKQNKTKSTKCKHKDKAEGFDYALDIVIAWN
ncbi:MAG: hypothetical protein QM504_06685 [Pseudomonadota bacterium]